MSKKKDRRPLNTLECTNCGNLSESDRPIYLCPKCGGLLQYKVIDPANIDMLRFCGEFTFWRYRSFLPSVVFTATMQEGGTPLYKAKRLSTKIGLHNLYFKDETRNPTCSFRDRCAALIISNVIDLGLASIVCATNGNMGASLSAYSARYGISCHLIVPKIVDIGKMAQMIVYDADIEECGETVDDAILKAEKMAVENSWYQATPELNPLVIEAQKTIAFEIFEQVGVPDWIVISMGSGGTLYSIWKGFLELLEIGLIDNLPRILGVQSDGCSPIVDAYYRIDRERRKPRTHAIAIFVRKPIFKDLAIKAIRESQGSAITVKDEEIFSAEQEIARLEGLFAEPASSGTVAAIKKIVHASLIERDEKVVCVIGGSGLKATDVLQALSRRRKTALVGADLSTKEKILRILEKGDAYGYQIWKELGRTLTRSAVYQHLDDLSKRGLTHVSISEGRKYFGITEKGKRILKAIEDVKAIL
ncbi:MAG: threonine synthase [Nitrososphaerota archaeon]|nr:threonine synthase [Candidatus Bathyarchaeota archaeon]MDW8048668.1 threonine synthase [Nitrososphaerota archaeon]